MNLKWIILCRSRRVKSLERILRVIKNENECLSNNIAHSCKEINKALLQGKVPSKIVRWVEEAKAIGNEANVLVKSARKNGSFLEDGQLRNMLTKINRVLKNCPFDHGLRPVDAPVLARGSYIDISSEEIGIKKPLRNAVTRVKGGISTAQEMVAEESMKTGEKFEMPLHEQDNIARLVKDINKALLQGKVVLKKLHNRVEEAEANQYEANEVVLSAQNNSSFLEGGQLRNVEDNIVDVLKKCPSERGLRPVNVTVIMNGSDISRRKEPQRKGAAHRMKVGISSAQ